MRLKIDGLGVYVPSLCMAVEHAFGILVTRFRIYKSLMRFDLINFTLIILVASKISNFTIDCSENFENSIPKMTEENDFNESPIVHLQNVRHTGKEYDRNRIRSREHSFFRNRIDTRLNQLGFILPGNLYSLQP